MDEVQDKLSAMRMCMREAGLAAVRLRASDWYAWATGGCSNVVLMATDTGVAEVLVTADTAFVLTDAIEAWRLQTEDPPPHYTIWSHPWQQPHEREAFIEDAAGGGVVASDRPGSDEVVLPSTLKDRKLCLTDGEVRSYRWLGKATAEAMTLALIEARTDQTEHELAADCSRALTARGVEALLVQVGGQRRITRFRHVLPTAAPLGERAMLAVCARHRGLVASATRFVSFRATTPKEEQEKNDVAAVEAVAWEQSRAGATLGAVYFELEKIYARVGHPDEINRHHQGGLTGYLAREALAAPGATTVVPASCALAFNPSFSGTKIEDTAVRTRDGIEIVTADAAWPTFEFDGRRRPDVLVRP